MIFGATQLADSQHPSALFRQILILFILGWVWVLSKVSTRGDGERIYYPHGGSGSEQQSAGEKRWLDTHH
jgi:hypothetical protein